MKKLIIIGALLIGLALQGLAQTDVITPGMNGLQTRNALNTAFSELLGVVDTIDETIRIGGIQITANAAEVNILDGALVDVAELNRLVGLSDNIMTLLGAKENSLGNPGTTGYVLSSTTAGVRSWIAPGSGGGAEYPAGSGIPIVVSGASWGTTITDNSTDWNAAVAAVEGAGVGIMAPDSTETSELNYLPWYSANQLIDTKISAAGGGEGGDYLVNALVSLGGKIIAAPIFCDMDASTTTALQDSDMFVVAIYLPKDTTLTGVRFSLGTQGDYTADGNNRIGLYKVSGTTATLVASTTNDPDTWKGAQYAWTDHAFSSPYEATKGGYYIGCLYNYSAQTAAPAIYSGEPIALMNQSSFMGNSVRLRGFITDKSDLPSSFSMTGFSSNTASPMIILY